MQYPQGLFIKKENPHIQIPLTGYVGLVLHSTAVTTATLQRAPLMVVWRYTDSTMTETIMHKVAAEYP